MDNTEGKIKISKNMANFREYIYIFFFLLFFCKGGVIIYSIGQKINLLTIVDTYKKEKRTYYKCTCECGNEYRFSSRQKPAYSCGCINRRSEIQRQDLTNQRFNKLVVTNMLYKYKNNQTYCKCICDCGNETIVYAGNLKSGKTKSCGCLEKESRFNREHADISIIGKKFGKLTVLEYSDKRAENSSVLWKCKCECGNICYTSSSILKSGKTKSCGCAKIKYINSTKIDVIGKKYGFLTAIDEVFNDSYKKRMVKCKCDCGSIGIYGVTDITTGHTMSCGCLNISKGELFIKELLKKNNIEYEPQKRFEDCKNKRTLPFDFYIPSHNLCIEYQGEQHYKPVEYWGGVEKFQIYKENDNIKKEYCKNNNINLLCLPYTLSNEEISNKILDILNPVTTTVA